MKKTWALISVALLAVSLTSCGGDDDKDNAGGSGTSDDSYCDQVKTLRDAFSDLDPSTMGVDVLTGLQDKLSRIEDSAPSDIKAEWGTLSGYFDTFDQLLKDAGLTADDLKALQEDPTKIPDGLDMAKIQEFGTKMAAAAEDADLQSASTAIETEVQEECGFSMGEESDSPSGSTPSS